MSSGRITARTWSGRNRPSAVSSGRSWRPATTDAPATSFWKMWLSTSRMTSAPGWVWLRRAQRLPIVPLDIHLPPSLQGARGQVGGGLELLRVADHEQRERRAQASSADQQVLTSADDRRAADDPVAVERKGLGARIAETVQGVLELEVHDRPLNPNLQPGPPDRDLATDLAQHGQLFLNRLGVGTSGGERLAQLRFLLRQRGSLLDQLVIGAVEVVDQQRHAGD